jgi:hypothetical protein
MEVQVSEVFVNESHSVNTLSTQSLTIEDQENLEVNTQPPQNFGQCLIPNCKEICYFGFKDSEQPFLCSLHCYENMVDFRAKGVYKVYYSLSCFWNEMVKVYCAIFVISTN